MAMKIRMKKIAFEHVLKRFHYELQRFQIPGFACILLMEKWVLNIMNTMTIMPMMAIFILS